MQKRILTALASVGLMLSVTALPGWAAPPVDSETYLYGPGECPTGLAFSENVPFWTSAAFTSTADGDHDINAGETLTTGLRMEHLGPLSIVPFGNGHVDFTVLGNSMTETFTPFEVVQEATGTLAETAVTIPAAAEGTVVTARVDGFTDDLYPGILDATTCITNDGEGTVGVYVNKVPVLNDDSVVTESELPVTIDVLANDEPTWDSGAIVSANPTLDQARALQDNVAWIDVPDADRADAVAVDSAPADGTATVGSDGNITYTPDADFMGTETFTYRVTDNDGATGTASITVDVTEPASVLAAVELTPSSTSVNQGESLTFIAEGFDADGESIGDVTGEVLLTSDHPTDVVSGNTVTFVTASPHVVTATHSTGVHDAVTIQVSPAGATTPVGHSGGAASRVGVIPDVGGPSSTWLLAALMSLTAGTIILARRSHLQGS